MNNTTIIIDGTFDSEKVIKVSGKDAEILSAYLNVIDKLHTIENFIGIHVLNFNQIFYHFDLDRAGTARKVRGIVSDEFVLINSLTINFITGGKTLIDVIEQFDKKSTKQISKFISSIYDNNFSYKLATTLRNFALHGHVPIYYNHGKYSFNLQYILREGSKFKFSKSFINSLIDIATKIQKEHGDIANIAYTSTIANYQYGVFQIIQVFLQNNKKFCNDLFYQAEKIISDQLEENTNILYFEVFDEVHSINVSDMSVWYDKLITHISNEQDNFEKIFSELILKK